MLQLDPITVLWQIVNFVALLAVLYFFLFRPLRAKLAERSEAVAEALQNARDQEIEATRLRTEWQERMHNVQQEANDVLVAAEREAAQRGALLMEETRVRIDRLTDEMRSDLIRQRDEVVAASFDGILETVIDMSGHVVQSVTTRRTHDDLVQNLLASLLRLPEDEIAEYRRIMAGRHAMTVVSTPVALTAEQTKAVSDTLSTLVDRPVELQIRIEPDLVAGLQIGIADRLLDNSIRQQLARIRDRVRDEMVSGEGVRA
jgi:F-type H+-transporting ATPase subunit b